MTVCAAHYNRSRQLSNTLKSYLHWYGKDSADWLRLVILDDSSDDPDELRRLLGSFPWPFQTHYVDRRNRKIRNPGIIYNNAVALAEDGLICLTNPECLHLGRVFDHAREKCQPGQYHIYGCRIGRPVAMDFSQYLEAPMAYVDYSTFQGWYQHTSLSCRMLHFCSVLWRGDYERIGGFDPAYDAGYAFEDNDFAEAALKNLAVSMHDRPYVLHQWHPRAQRDEELIALEKRNSDLFQAKWGHGPRRLVKEIRPPS